MKFNNSIEKKKLRRKERKEIKKKKKLKSVNKKNTSTNIHHKIARARGGSNHSDNTERIPVSVHNAIHQYLGIKKPHEQIEQILNDNFSTLCKATRNIIKEEVLQILDYYNKWGELYDKKCISGKDRFPNQK